MLHVLYVRFAAGLLHCLRNPTPRGADANITREYTAAAVEAYRRALVRPEARAELLLCDDSGRVPFDVLRAALVAAGDMTYGDEDAIIVSALTGVPVSAPVPLRSAPVRPLNAMREDMATLVLLRGVTDELARSYRELHLEKRRRLERLCTHWILHSHLAVSAGQVHLSVAQPLALPFFNIAKRVQNDFISGKLSPNLYAFFFTL